MMYICAMKRSRSSRAIYRENAKFGGSRLVEENVTLANAYFVLGGLSIVGAVAVFLFRKGGPWGSADRFDYNGVAIMLKQGMGGWVASFEIPSTVKGASTKFDVSDPSEEIALMKAKMRIDQEQKAPNA